MRLLSHGTRSILRSVRVVSSLILFQGRELLDCKITPLVHFHDIYKCRRFWTFAPPHTHVILIHHLPETLSSFSRINKPLIRYTVHKSIRYSSHTNYPPYTRNGDLKWNHPLGPFNSPFIRPRGTIDTLDHCGSST